MVARSRSSLRRPNLRGDPASSESTSPGIDAQSQPDLQGLRSKRVRIPSISDPQRINKKLRIKPNVRPRQLNIPLRSRRVQDGRTPKPAAPKINTKPVLSSRKPATLTPVSLPTSGDETKNATLAKAKEKPSKLELPPLAADIFEGRSLRSHDGGSRSKSELAMYFNNYEQMLSLEPSKPDALTPRTLITVIGDMPGAVPLRPKKFNINPDPFGTAKPLYNAQIIDLLSSHPISPRRQTSDPLDADLYHKAHRKAERLEKQLRNIEKERAQHEKVQLDRLLEELKGPDWLKVMGISGVTESEKKLYEPKRAFFVREVAGLIEKFKHWKEEEKRRKLEREQALLEDAVDQTEEAEGVEDEEEEEEGEEEEEEEEEEEDDDQEQQHNTSTTSGPSADAAGDYITTNDVDALAARQLHHEASLLGSPLSNIPLVRRRPGRPPKNRPPDPESPLAHSGLLANLDGATSLDPKPFTSFYAKRHLRDAAVGGHRRAGRSVTAFGESVPDLEEREFGLSADILTKEAVRQRARRKRREGRGSGED